MHVRIRMLFLALTLAATGCASGPKYSDVATRIPPVQADQGRIYFYRTAIMGAAIQPDVRVNDEVVGKSVPKGFFFVDRPPGDYVVACSTEAEHRQSFTLEAAQVRYVKLLVSMGFFAGHVSPELVNEEQALKDLAKMSYTGDQQALAPAP